MYTRFLLHVVQYNGNNDNKYKATGGGQDETISAHSIKAVGLRIYSETPVSGADRKFLRKRAAVAGWFVVLLLFVFF